MTCITPIRLKKENKLTHEDEFVYIPCGHCEGCLKSKQSAWISRLMVENLYSRSAFFITLTYDTPHLPIPYGVSKTDIQKFMKRLRKDISCRVFGVSEYGGVHGRPHYHLCLFSDVPLTIIQMSNIIQDNWQMGNHCIGYIDIASISYVAKYCLKPRKDPLGIYWSKTFAFMSKRPGIGADFLTEDIQPFLDNDCFEFSVLGSRPFSMPRYYRDKVFDDEAKERHAFKMQEKYKSYNDDIYAKNEAAYKRVAFERKQKEM